MDDINNSVESLSRFERTDIVQAADRSSKDKKKNGFSDALKEKMKEKLKEEEKDQFVSHHHTEDDDSADEHKQEDSEHDVFISHAQPGDETEDKINNETKQRQYDEPGDDSALDHIDIKA